MERIIGPPRRESKSFNRRYATNELVIPTSLIKLPITPVPLLEGTERRVRMVNELVKIIKRIQRRQRLPRLGVHDVGVFSEDPRNEWLSKVPRGYVGRRPCV